jgi:hypothetical protein
LLVEWLLASSVSSRLVMAMQRSLRAPAWWMAAARSVGSSGRGSSGCDGVPVLAAVKP